MENSSQQSGRTQPTSLHFFENEEENEKSESSSKSGAVRREGEKEDIKIWYGQGTASCFIPSSSESREYDMHRDLTSTSPSPEKIRRRSAEVVTRPPCLSLSLIPHDCRLHILDFHYWSPIERSDFEDTSLYFVVDLDTPSYPVAEYGAINTATEEASTVPFGKIETEVVEEENREPTRKVSRISADQRFSFARRRRPVRTVTRFVADFGKFARYLYGYFRTDRTRARFLVRGRRNLKLSFFFLGTNCRVRTGGRSGVTRYHERLLGGLGIPIARFVPKGFGRSVFGFGVSAGGRLVLSTPTWHRSSSSWFGSDEQCRLKLISSWRDPVILPGLFSFQRAGAGGITETIAIGELVTHVGFDGKCAECLFSENSICPDLRKLRIVTTEPLVREGMWKSLVDSGRDCLTDLEIVSQKGTQNDPEMEDIVPTSIIAESPEVMKRLALAVEGLVVAHPPFAFNRVVRLRFRDCVFFNNRFFSSENFGRIFPNLEVFSLKFGSPPNALMGGSEVHKAIVESVSQCPRLRVFSVRCVGGSRQPTDESRDEIMGPSLVQVLLGERDCCLERISIPLGVGGYLSPLELVGPDPPFVNSSLRHLILQVANRDKLTSDSLRGFLRCVVSLTHFEVIVAIPKFLQRMDSSEFGGLQALLGRAFGMRPGLSNPFIPFEFSVDLLKVLHEFPKLQHIDLSNLKSLVIPPVWVKELALSLPNLRFLGITIPSTYDPTYERSNSDMEVSKLRWPRLYLDVLMDLLGELPEVEELKLIFLTPDAPGFEISPNLGKSQKLRRLTLPEVSSQVANALLSQIPSLSVLDFTSYRDSVVRRRFLFRDRIESCLNLNSDLDLAFEKGTFLDEVDPTIENLENCVGKYSLTPPFCRDSDWNRYELDREKLVSNEESDSECDSPEVDPNAKDDYHDRMKKILNRIPEEELDRAVLARVVRSAYLDSFRPKYYGMSAGSTVYSVWGSGTGLEFGYSFHYRGRSYGVEDFGSCNVHRLGDLWDTWLPRDELKVQGAREDDVEPSDSGLEFPKLFHYYRGDSGKRMYFVQNPACLRMLVRRILGKELMARLSDHSVVLFVSALVPTMHGMEYGESETPPKIAWFESEFLKRFVSIEAARQTREEQKKVLRLEEKAKIQTSWTGFLEERRKKARVQKEGRVEVLRTTWNMDDLYLSMDDFEDRKRQTRSDW